MRNQYLLELTRMEAPPADQICGICSSNNAIYKCVDCHGEPVYCADCCVTLHFRSPFHRIKCWNGSYFKSSDLNSLRLIIHAGHGGRECPCYAVDNFGLPEGILEGVTGDSWIDEDKADLSDAAQHSDGPNMDPGVSPLSENQEPWGPFIPETDRILVVTSNGVFRRRIRWCRCAEHAESHIQLLHLQMFPASKDRPSTAFTFELLDHFHIDAMECKTAALNFYNKLRRITNNAFPATVQV